MLKNICGKQLGSDERDTCYCYKELNHNGNCYKSFGLEIEALMQELLAQCDCPVVKATEYEDHTMKIDFWVRITKVRCNGDYIEDFLPIQFTIDRDAAYRLKGTRALGQGVIIICIKADEILEWKEASDATLKEVVKFRIYRDFCDKVERVAACLKELHREIPFPTRKFDRFQLRPVSIPSQTNLSR